MFRGGRQVFQVGQAPRVHRNSTIAHVALCQRVRGVIARTRYTTVLTYLLTYISSTIGCANFGPDWPLLFKVHEI